MILLVACGNTLRRDDGAGLELAQRLGARCRPSDLEIHRCHQLTPDLGLLLAAPGVAAVLFADAAMCMGEEDLASPMLRRISAGGGALPLGHHLAPEALLALAATLYGRRPPAWQVVIPGIDFDFGEGLSPLAAESVARAEREIEAFLVLIRANLSLGQVPL